jgi:hypothetical protein
VQLLFEDTLQPFVEVSCETAARRAGEPGGVVRGLGDLSRAHALLDESRARFEAAGDDPGLANVLVRLYLLRRRGPRGGAPAAIGGARATHQPRDRRDAAEQYLAEARDIFRRAGDRVADELAKDGAPGPRRR